MMLPMGKKMLRTCAADGKGSLDYSVLVWGWPEPLDLPRKVWEPLPLVARHRLT
jgi:hypothetical protein